MLYLTFVTDCINNINYCYTTSSCAGRIIVVKSFVDAQLNKKFNIEWVYLTHDIKNVDEEVDIIWNSLEGIENQQSLLEGQELWFKMEPPIVALRMRDIENTKALLDIFRTNGFKNSGIRSMNQDGSIALTLVDTHKIETLVGVHDQPMLLTKEYLKLMYQNAIHKLETSRSRIEKLRIVLSNLQQKQ